MALMRVLTFPEPRLREKAETVGQIDAALRQIVQNMFETMYHEHGVGLAANQVGVLQRIIVLDVSRNQEQPVCLINPQILETRGKLVMDEGCISFPGLYFPVERPEWVKIRAQDQEGEFFELEGDGLLGRCIQHEMDHLEGKVFTDYLSPLKLQRLLKKAKKAQ